MIELDFYHRKFSLIVRGVDPSHPEEVMTQKRRERTLEMHVDIDAPIEAAWKAITEGPGIANWFAPVAEVSAPGVGATVKAGWSEEMMMTSTVDAWEPLKHVRWLDESGWMGPGTSLAVDYHLSTENGKTLAEARGELRRGIENVEDTRARPACRGSRSPISLPSASYPVQVRGLVQVRQKWLLTEEVTHRRIKMWSGKLEVRIDGI